MSYFAALPDLTWASEQHADLETASKLADCRARVGPDREAMVFVLVPTPTGRRARNFARFRPGEAPQAMLAFPPFRQLGLVLTHPPAPAPPTEWTREGALQLALAFPAREREP